MHSPNARCTVSARRRFVRLIRQRQQQLDFFSDKHLVRLAMGGAMLAQADLLEAPLQSPPIGLLDISKMPPRQNLLTHYRNTSLARVLCGGPFAPWLGRPRIRSVFPVRRTGRVERRIVQIGLKHIRLSRLSNTISRGQAWKNAKLRGCGSPTRWGCPDETRSVRSGGAVARPASTDKGPWPCVVCSFQELASNPASQIEARSLPPGRPACSRNQHRLSQRPDRERAG